MLLRPTSIAARRLRRRFLQRPCLEEDRSLMLAAPTTVASLGLNFGHSSPQSLASSPPVRDIITPAFPSQRPPITHSGSSTVAVGCNTHTATRTFAFALFKRISQSTAPLSDPSSSVNNLTDATFALLRAIDRMGSTSNFVVDGHQVLIDFLWSVSDLWRPLLQQLTDARLRKGQRCFVTNGFLRQARHVYQRGGYPELYFDLVLQVHNLAAGAARGESVSKESLKQAHTFTMMTDVDIFEWTVSMCSKKRDNPTVEQRSKRITDTLNALQLALQLISPARIEKTLRFAAQGLVFLASGDSADDALHHVTLFRRLVETIRIEVRIRPEDVISRSAVIFREECFVQLELLRLPHWSPLLRTILDGISASSLERAASVPSERGHSKTRQLLLAATDDVVRCIRLAATCHADSGHRRNAVTQVLVWGTDYFSSIRTDSVAFLPLDVPDVHHATVGAISEYHSLLQFGTLRSSNRHLPSSNWVCGCGSENPPTAILCFACVLRALGSPGRSTVSLWTCPECRTSVEDGKVSAVCAACGSDHPQVKNVGPFCVTCFHLLGEAGECNCAAPSDSSRRPDASSAMRACGGTCPACHNYQPPAQWSRRFCSTCGESLASTIVAQLLAGDATPSARQVNLSTYLRTLMTWHCDCGTVNVGWRNQQTGEWQWNPCKTCQAKPDALSNMLVRQYQRWQCGCGALNAPDAMRCHSCATNGHWLTCVSCMQHCAVTDSGNCASCGAMHPARISPKVQQCPNCAGVLPAYTADGRRPLEYCLHCSLELPAALRTAEDEPWICVSCGEGNKGDLGSAAWKAKDVPLEIDLSPDRSLWACNRCGADRPVLSAWWKCSSCAHPSDRLCRDYACEECGAVRPELASVAPFWGCECGHSEPGWHLKCSACARHRRDMQVETFVPAPWLCPQCNAEHSTAVDSARYCCKHCAARRPLSGRTTDSSIVELLIEASRAKLYEPHSPIDADIDEPFYDEHDHDEHTGDVSPDDQVMTAMFVAGLP